MLAWGWFPALIALVAALGTVVLYCALKAQERAQFERVVRLATDSIQADIASDMQIRIQGLVRIAKLWQLQSKFRKDEFELYASLYENHDPGCTGVAWVNRSFQLMSVVPLDGDSELRELYLANEDQRRELQKALTSRGAIVTRSAQHQGSRFLFIWVPGYAGDEFQGFIVGVFRVEPLLNDVLSDHAELGYSVAISDGDKPIYILHPESWDQEKQWGQTASVPLPGVNWGVRVWPDATLMPKTQSLSTVVLVGGLLMAGLLALAARLAQKAQSAAGTTAEANARLEKEVAERRRAEESLHTLSARLLKVQDEERHHIAHELHEGTAQKLYGLSMNLRLISEWAPPQHPQAQKKFTESLKLADECVREMRTLSYLLHPPSLDMLGFVDACQTLAQGFMERSGIEVELDLPARLGRLPQDWEVALFRIVQESLSNIHRHSGSKTACIRLSNHEGLLALEVSDNGRGFDQGTLDRASDRANFGVGIAGMRERLRQLGGQLHIESSASGTSITATLPYDVYKNTSPIIDALSAAKSEA